VCGGGNQICGLRMIVQNGLFAECKVLDSFWGVSGPSTSTCGPSTRTFLEDNNTAK